MPFYLPEQAQVSCQVIAVNSRCDSVASVGFGAVMPVLAVMPDQPTIQFVSRGCETLTVQCNPGPFDGGAPVTDYLISYVQFFETNNFNNNRFM